MDIAEEREILEAVRAGRKERFEAIVREHQRQAYRIALGLVHNAHDAMDLAQEAFLRAYRALRSFDTTQPFFPWFYRILRNLCLSHLKRRRRLFSFRRHKNGEEEDAEVDVPSDAPGPDVLVQRSELIDRFYAAFRRLSPRDSEILTLRHFEGMAYAEIAGVLDIPVGTVMSRLYYARRKLRARLEKDLDES